MYRSPTDVAARGEQVNEFVKRVRAAKIHVLIMGHLRKQMPSMMGKQKAQDKLLRDLPTHFAHVQREHHLPAGAPWVHPGMVGHQGSNCRAGGVQHGRRLTLGRLSTGMPRRAPPARGCALDPPSRLLTLAWWGIRLAVAGGAVCSMDSASHWAGSAGECPGAPLVAPDATSWHPALASAVARLAGIGWTGGHGGLCVQVLAGPGAQP